MPYPYDDIIRHAWSPGDVVCEACYGQVLNRACGKEWCPCTCMEHPSAQVDLQPDFTAPTQEVEEEFMPIDYPKPLTVPEKPGPPTWKIPDDAVRPPTSEELGPLMIPERDDRFIEGVFVNDKSDVAYAFWVGTLATATCFIIGLADSLNPWLRGILIALVALTAMAGAGRRMK